MIDFRLAQLQNHFERVHRQVARAKRRFLYRVGALVRTIARRSIRKRKAVAEAGAPPSSHAGNLRKGILFAVDEDDERAVIGPAREWTRTTNGDAMTIPALLEFGGDVTGTTKKKGRPQAVQFDYDAHPYMGPALETAEPTIADLWDNLVR